MKSWLAVCVVVLVLLRNDFLFWPADAVLFGFFPACLAHQAMISILAALLWWAAVTFAWPSDLEAPSDVVELER